jgi:signal transduction histidine kinase
LSDLATPRALWGRLIARSPAHWTVLLLIAAALTATAAHSYRNIRDELTTVALARREAVAQLIATALAEKFGRLEDVAISLATRPRAQDLVAHGKWLEASNYLRTVPRDLPHIERLFLADTKGTLKADVPALAGVRGTNFAHRDWYRGVSRRWRPYVSPVYTRAAAPRLNVFVVAAPVKSAAGGVVGILVLQIRNDRLLEWVERIGIGPEGFIYVVDSKGQVAFHSRHRERAGIVDLSGTTVVEELRRGGRGVETGFDPEEREDSIVAYARVPGYDWGVVVQQPSRSSLGFMVRDALLRQLLAGYGLILLLGTAAIFLAARIAGTRRQAEEDRRVKAELEQRVALRTVQLEATNKELEAFSYSVSHDLRAPLRSIDGFSQALLEDYAPRLDAAGRDCLQRVRVATQRMAELIDDLLQLSRVTRAEMHREPVDLSALAAETVAALRHAHPERTVKTRIEPNLSTDADPRLLRVLLNNLLGNAWKFTGRRTDACIELVLAGREKGRPVFSVSDNGAGFDPAHANKLFKAFQRLHSPADFPGTGIGLATVQRIVNRHGGRVWAEGQVEEGATFYFTV